jgi:hypothetical protein
VAHYHLLHTLGKIKQLDRDKEYKDLTVRTATIAIKCITIWTIDLVQLHHFTLDNLTTILLEEEATRDPRQVKITL